MKRNASLSVRSQLPAENEIGGLLWIGVLVYLIYLLLIGLGMVGR